MITEQGLKLIEYNFRPGDPEWLNTLSVLNGSVVDLVESVMKRDNATFDFSSQATITKYLVPEGYPEHHDCVLNVVLEKDSAQAPGVKLYYSCGEDDQGRLRVGSERGLAFVACAETMEEAYQKIEQCIATVDGKFLYREDIGSREQINQKCDNVKNLKGQK
jgi:phosphoribosylamine--glycine ligase